MKIRIIFTVLLYSAGVFISAEIGRMEDNILDFIFDRAFELIFAIIIGVILTVCQEYFLKEGVRRSKSQVD